MTGRATLPFFVIANQRGHEKQLTDALQLFLRWYRGLELVWIGAEGTTAQPAGTSLERHMTELLGPAWRPEQLIYRRVGGARMPARLKAFCQELSERSHEGLLIVDEPQYGASGVASAEGDRPCVLDRFFRIVEQELGTATSLRFIGLSATPFELNDLSQVWEVRQSLDPGYPGSNMFNGSAIAPEAEIAPPEVLTLTAFCRANDLPALRCETLTSYRKALKKRPPAGADEGAIAFETALSKVIMALIDGWVVQEGELGGLCVRALVSNPLTAAMMERLPLDPARVQLISAFGDHARGLTIREQLERRRAPHLPYVAFVTGRARMADAFPASTCAFLDLTRKSTDLNSLLQGLIGRACGYGKRSLVLVSEENHATLTAYAGSGGAYVSQPSRHTTFALLRKRGAPVSVARLCRDMNDSRIRTLFDVLDTHVVAPFCPPSARLSPKRGSRSGGQAQFRHAPILRIAESLRLFDYLEDPAVWHRLLPHLPFGAAIARPEAEVPSPQDPDRMLRYAIVSPGECRFTFRWVSDDDRERVHHGRARGGPYKGYIEPTIYLEKADLTSGALINDHSAPATVGEWRANAITFPLVRSVAPLMKNVAAYPTHRCVFDAIMTSDEQAARDWVH